MKDGITGPGLYVSERVCIFPHFGLLSFVLERGRVPMANIFKTQNFQPISPSPLGGLCSTPSAIICNTG